MAKYFKATIQPKKSFINSNPEEAIELVLASDEFDTQAEFKEALVAMLTEEGIAKNYFAPKTEKCTKEECEAINAENDSADSNDGDSDGNEQLQEVQSNLPSESKTVADIIEFVPELAECEDSIESTIENFVNGTLPEAYDGITKQQAIDWAYYLVKTCQCQAAELLNVRLLRRVFESTYHQEIIDNEPHAKQEFAPDDFNDDATLTDTFEDGEMNPSTGEIIDEQPQKEIYRWFEFVKGYACVLKTEFDSASEKWIASFAFTNERPVKLHQLTKRFEKEENAALNAMGAFINHITDIKNMANDAGFDVSTWYIPTVKGLSGEGEQRLVKSIVPAAQALEVLGQMDIEETTGERKTKDSNQVYHMPDDHISDGTILDSTTSQELTPDIPAHVQPIIDALVNHADYKNQKGVEAGNDSFIVKVAGHLSSILGDADETAIEQCVETVESLRTIGHLVKFDECLAAFEIVVDDSITNNLSNKYEYEAAPSKKLQPILLYPCVFDAIAKVCERWKGEGQALPKPAFDAFIKCVREGSDDKMIADHILANVKNPNVFLGVGAMQIAMALNVHEHEPVIKKEKGKPLSKKLAAQFSKAKPEDVTIEKNGPVVVKSEPLLKPEKNPTLSDGYPEKIYKAGEKASEPDQFEAVELSKAERADYVKAQNKAVDEAESFDWLADLQSGESEEKQAPMSDFEKQVADLNAKLSTLKAGETLRLEDVPNDVYHACDGVSSTKLKVAIESLMKYDAKFVSKTMPQPEDENDKALHFKEGNLAHTLTLEPELADVEYFKLPDDYELPTDPQFKKYDEWVKLGKPSEKENKKAYPTPLMLKRCGAHYELMQQANGRCVIPSDSWAKAEAMAKAVRTDADCKQLVCNPSLKTEISYFKRDAETDLLIKCRPDMELGIICADLKTISLRANPDEDYLINALRREVLNRGYHVSAAMYMEIADLKQWIWVFVNKEDGYHWAAPIRASESLIYGDDEREGGYHIYRKYLAKIAECYKTGIWPKPASIQMQTDENGKRHLAEI